MRKGYASAITRYGETRWASEATEGADERGAGARGGASARARSAREQDRIEGAPSGVRSASALDGALHSATRQDRSGLVRRRGGRSGHRRKADIGGGS